jgi:hypothetical protein
MTTQTKHTPGPWSVTESFCNNACNRLVVKRKTWGGEVVADLGEAPDASRANARLIAAAPDLLEALRGLLRETKAKNPSPKVGKDFSLLVHIEAARKAIAQAEGTQ